jgi:hypothetical protein
MEDDLERKRDGLGKDIRRLNAVHAGTHNRNLRHKPGPMILARGAKRRQIEVSIGQQVDRSIAKIGTTE